MTFRRLVGSLLLSLLLLGCLASSVMAAPASTEADPTPPSSACFKVYPPYQKVAVGQPATLSFYGYNQCPITPNSKVTITVTWGDGAVSVVPICTSQICPAVLPTASHAYKEQGTYYPRSCIDIPGVFWFAPPCVSAQVDVTG